MSCSHSAILGFGRYLPVGRITTEEIAKAHGQDPSAIHGGLGVEEKTVPQEGEDSFTMAFEAGKQALEQAELPSSEISAVYVGSESHPYAVKPTSSMVASALQVHPFSLCADLQFACKAGTAGVQIVDALVRCGQIRYGLAIGSDTAQGRPGDALEYTAAAGAAALILGSCEDKRALCRIDHTLSFTSDTPDFWRAQGEQFPAHAGRFTGEPGYFAHMREAIKGILNVSQTAIGDYDHIVLHMPNAKFPSKIAKEFGIKKEQLEHGFIVPRIGNTYAACSLLGLTFALEHAKKAQRILLVSYGSGAGCDAFAMTMLRDGHLLPADHRASAYMDYGTYLQRVTAAAH
jgi:hydroxymethylglutaryl-CoA synthase